MNEGWTLKKERRYDSDFLALEGLECLEKTSVFNVVSKSDDTVLGIIKWHPPWRHYCFFPSRAWYIVLSSRCLKDLARFVENLNEDHKTGEDMKW